MPADALPPRDEIPTPPPGDRRGRFAALLSVYELHTGDVAALGPRARLAAHPAVARQKWRLESEWLDELAAAVPDRPVDDAVAELRALAARDRLPGAYRWLARRASWEEAVEFLSLEGGPDGGFDDLVALCQVGLAAGPKLELARNYWDELGDGDPDAVHTRLHDRLVAAVGIRSVPLAEQPVEALERAALGGLLATNHWLQPEMLGALGLTELQAGPRCRMVLTAFDRLGAPREAYPFYEVHAAVDPRHGQDWLDNVVAPLAAARPDWGARMVRGARWRAHVNSAFFGAVLRRTGTAAAA